MKALTATIAIAIGIGVGAGLCLAVAARAHEAHRHGGTGPPPRFEAPAPGSYVLPPIARIEEHVLLDSKGEAASLPGLGEGAVAFVSFVYLSCGETCPLATASLADLDGRIAGDEATAGRVELVTVSFDPERDTPEAMARLRAGLHPKGRWRFLTAESTDAVAPVLRDFGQDAVLLRGPDGDFTGELRHVLKVFLLDDQGRVRNVYSTGFLDPRLLLNDAKTLLMEPPPGS